jgi:hypothetical protein
LINPESAALQRVITLQYNPFIVAEIEVRAGGQEIARGFATAGPPVETINLEAETMPPIN